MARLKATESVAEATEIELAHQLQQFGATVPGLDQYAAWQIGTLGRSPNFFLEDVV